MSSGIETEADEDDVGIVPVIADAAIWGTWFVLFNWSSAVYVAVGRGGEGRWALDLVFFLVCVLSDPSSWSWSRSRSRSRCRFLYSWVLMIDMLVEVMILVDMDGDQCGCKIILSGRGAKVKGEKVG